MITTKKKDNRFKLKGNLSRFGFGKNVFKKTWERSKSKLFKEKDERR